MSRSRPYIPNGCDYQGRMPEMAVYDPSDDDEREPMTPADAVTAVLIYVVSVCFVAWVFNLAACWVANT